MAKKSPNRPITKLANALGLFGYTSVLMQWLWLFATLLLPIANNPTVRYWIAPSASDPSEQLPVISPSLPEPVQYILIILSVIFIAGVIIYLIKSVPKAIGQTGKTITQGSAKIVAPHLIEKRKLPAKQEKKLFERITWVMKLAILAIPLLALLIPVEASFDIEYLHVVAFGLFCGAWSLFWFGLQFVVVRWFKLDLKKIW